MDNVIPIYMYIVVHCTYMYFDLYISFVLCVSVNHELFIIFYFAAKPGYPARDSGIGDINSPKPEYPAQDSDIGDINSPKPEYPAQDSGIGDINSPKPGYPAQDSGIGDINPAIRTGTEKNGNSIGTHCYYC